MGALSFILFYNPHDDIPAKGKTGHLHFNRVYKSNFSDLPSQNILILLNVSDKLKSRNSVRVMIKKRCVFCCFIKSPNYGLDKVIS